MLFLVCVFVSSEKAASGWFGPVSGDFCDLGVSTTLKATCIPNRDYQCDNLSWIVPNDCTIIDNDSKEVKFRCSLFGQYVIKSNHHLSYEFEITGGHALYKWIIVMNDTDTELCHETSLCWKNRNMKMRVWVAPESEACDDGEFQRISYVRSDISREITRRFHAIGESPSIRYGHDIYNDSFVYVKDGDCWEGNIYIDQEMPQQFNVDGRRLSDFFSQIRDIDGRFYPVPVFDGLFEKAEFVNSAHVADLRSCECATGVSSFLFNGNAFLTFSGYEKSEVMRLKGVPGSVKSIGFTRESVFAVTDDGAYCGSLSKWTKLEEINGDVNFVRTSAVCSCVPSENNVYVMVANDNEVYIGLERIPLFATLTDKVYDLVLGLYRIVAAVRLHDNSTGYVVYDVKTGAHDIISDEFGSHVKLEMLRDGGFLAYGDGLRYSLDMKSMREIDVPLFPGESVEHLAANGLKFGLVTSEHRIFYGSLVSKMTVNIWSPCDDDSLNVFYKGDALHALFYDREADAMKTVYLYTKDENLKSVCVDCPEHDPVVHVDLSDSIDLQYIVGCFDCDKASLSVDAPGFVGVTYSQERIACSCVELWRMVSNVKNVFGSWESPAACAIHTMNVSISPNYAPEEPLERAIGTGVVRVFLDGEDGVQYTDRIEMITGFPQEKRLKIVFHGTKCYDVDESGNPQTCIFDVLYGDTAFRPVLSICGNDGCESLNDDFVLIDESSNVDYEFVLSASRAGCVRKPQNAAEMNGNWSKSTYHSCFIGGHAPYNPAASYEVMNATSNGINFKGPKHHYSFRLVVLGSSQTFYDRETLVKVNVLNHPSSPWILAYSALVALVIMVNMTLYVFWRNMAFSFAEFYSDKTR